MEASGLHSNTSDEENYGMAAVHAEKNSLHTSATSVTRNDIQESELRDNDLSVEPEILSALGKYIDTLHEKDSRQTGDNERKNPQPRMTDDPSDASSLDQAEVSPEMLSLVRRFIDRLPQEESALPDSAHVEIDPETKAAVEEHMAKMASQAPRNTIKRDENPNTPLSRVEQTIRNFEGRIETSPIPKINEPQTAITPPQSATVEDDVENVVTAVSNVDTKAVLQSASTILPPVTHTHIKKLVIERAETTKTMESDSVSRYQDEAGRHSGTSGEEHTFSTGETPPKSEKGTKSLHLTSSNDSDSRVRRLIDAVGGWAGDGSFLDHPLLRDVSLDSDALDVLEALVADAGSFSVEEQSLLDEATVPEALGQDIKSLLDAIHNRKAGEPIKVPSSLIRLKKDPPTGDNDAAEVVTTQSSPAVSESSRDKKLSNKLTQPVDPDQRKELVRAFSSELLSKRRFVEKSEEKKDEESDDVQSAPRGTQHGNGEDTPWWEATAKLAVASVEDAPWLQATARLAVASIDALSGAENSDSASETTLEETIDAATYFTQPQNAAAASLQPQGGVNDDIAAFWKSQHAVRERRMHFNNGLKVKPQVAELPHVNIASFSYNSQITRDSENTRQSEQTEHTGHSGSFSKTSSHSFDTMDENWLLKRSMADYTPWGKPQWLGSKKTTVLDVDDPDPINGVEASRLLYDLSYRWRERRDAFFSSGWSRPYEKRCSRHKGYQGVDKYSLRTSSSFLREKPHRLDKQPWERREVKQFFLHEQSVSRRNWFGRFKRYSSIQVDLPVCRPRSMEMPVRAPEWTEDWYRTPYLQSLGTNLSGSADGEATDYYRKYVQSHDDFEYDEDWEDTPECGTLKNVIVKPGERISRVTPELTSSLRRSRWRKKYFPKGTFPY